MNKKRKEKGIEEEKERKKRREHKWKMKEDIGKLNPLNELAATQSENLVDRTWLWADSTKQNKRRLWKQNK